MKLKLISIGPFVKCIAILGLLLIMSCKRDWLDAKPNKSLVVPETLEDYQALLDNTTIMNYKQPGLNIISDDNSYLTSIAFQAITKQERSAYIWDDTENFYDGKSSSDWEEAYKRILYANVVLDGISTLMLNSAGRPLYNSIKGSSLFYRSLDFYNLAQQFCKPYLTTSNSDLGLPLRTSSNVNIKIQRSTVENTYSRIIDDLKTSASLLPVKQQYLTRPSKPAAFALLSRVLLSMGHYDESRKYADSCLYLFSNLIDYSTLNPAAPFPIGKYNDEIIYHCTIASYAAFKNTRLIIDPSFYQSFTAENNDLRTNIFFTTVAGNKTFKGSYFGSSTFFGGLATDEIYLNRAECLARQGKLTEALLDLNTLLKSRWKKNTDGTSTYVDKIALSKDHTLNLILLERRKELCFRGLRWTDLRRLNKETPFMTTITRSFDGTTYTLLPNSSKYIFPIDNKEILLGGILQNPR